MLLLRASDSFNVSVKQLLVEESASCAKQLVCVLHSVGLGLLFFIFTFTVQPYFLVKNCTGMMRYKLREVQKLVYLLSFSSCESINREMSHICRTSVDSSVLIQGQD